MTLNLQSNLSLAHDENFVGQVTAPVDQGLILVEEPESSYTHDDWDPATQFVSSGPNSIYLSVRPSVDGPVEIGLVRESAAVSDVAGTTYFEGVIETATGWIAIHDADDTFSFTLRLHKGTNRLKVLVDQPGLASRMLVIFG